MATHDAAGYHDDHGHKQSFLERWSSRPTTRTSARCTWCSPSSCSSSARHVGADPLELMTPGLQHMKPEFFNQMTTVHALVMIFGGVMPAFVGLANWMVPLQIGAPGHGAAAHEQLVLLDHAVRLHDAAAHAVPAGRRTRRRLDALSAAVDPGAAATSPSRSSPST
jgi:hypothetical protein